MSTKPRHECTQCDRSYSSQQKFRQHELVHTAGQPPRHQCPQCHKSYAYESALRAHIRQWHVDDDRFKCAHCDYKATDKSTLKTHSQRRHTGERPSACTKCDKTFVTLVELARHDISVHTADDISRQHECTTCHKCFKSRGQLKSHSGIHLQSRSHECADCKATFKRKCDLYRHKMQVHTANERVACMFTGCNKLYKASEAMMLHWRRDHGEQTRFQCNTCGHIGTTKEGLAIHYKRLHTDDRPFACVDCDASFATNSAMMSHMRNVHTAEHMSRQHECPTCRKCFKTQVKLALHAAVHTLTRSYECDQCHAAFKTGGGLRQHQDQMHSTHARMMCSYAECTKSFKSAGQLRAHQIRMHLSNGVKRWTCSKGDCAYASTERIRLARHYQSAHVPHNDDNNERPHKCTNCERKFVSRQGMMKHLTKIHASTIVDAH